MHNQHTKVIGNKIHSNLNDKQIAKKAHAGYKMAASPELTRSNEINPKPQTSVFSTDMMIEYHNTIIILKQIPGLNIDFQAACDCVLDDVSNPESSP